MADKHPRSGDTTYSGASTADEFADLVLLDEYDYEYAELVRLCLNGKFAEAIDIVKAHEAFLNPSKELLEQYRPTSLVAGEMAAHTPLQAVILSAPVANSAARHTFIAYMLESGADADQYGVLAYAVRLQDLDTVKLLLLYGAVPCAANCDHPGHTRPVRVSTMVVAKKAVQHATPGVAKETAAAILDLLQQSVIGFNEPTVGGGGAKSSPGGPRLRPGHRAWVYR